MSYDPYDDATNAGERANILYGQLNVRPEPNGVVLLKGQGVQAFNSQIHSEDQRRTQFTIALNPLDAMNKTRMIERKIITDSAEWTRIVWASARTAGIQHARELDGKWCKVEMAPSGRKWADKQTGDEVVGTTFKFLAFYVNESECLAAFRTDRPTTVDEDIPFDTTPATNGNVTSNMERNTALQFLPALVKAANGDVTQLKNAIDGMPLISKYFYIDSPEVQSLLKVAD